MEEKVTEFVKGYGLGRKEPVVVAVSGGVDSVVLLDLMANAILSDKLIVAHVNHGLRKESGAEEKFVENLAKEYGVGFYIKKLKLKSKSENAARKERYKFLRQVKDKTGAKYIITAHHLNDQVETVLLNLTRGSGPLDLWGMEEYEGDILRPLLQFSKQELRSYAKRKKLKYVEDKSNKNLNFSRNRIRHKVIPELEKINTGFLKTLKTNIKLGDEANQVIEKRFFKAQKEVVKENTINLSKLKKYDVFIQKEIVRQIFFSMTGKKEGIYSKNIEEILKLVGSPGTKITKIGAFTIEKTYDKIVFGAVAKKAPKSVKIIPESTQGFGGFIFKSKFGSEKTGKNNILLPAQIAYNLSIRTWKAGDRIKTKAGAKKLQDVFTDRKIPSSERKIWPVVTHKDKIIWVPLLAATKDYISEKEKAFIIEVKIER